MKANFFLLFILMMAILDCQTSRGIEIKGGMLMDVVIVSGDNSDSTFTPTDLVPPGGPDVLDVDKDGNIYILDRFGCKILKFDKKGKWIPAFRLAMKRMGTVPGNMAVDNQGNVYVERDRRILKFSPEGKFLFQSKDVKKEGEYIHTVGSDITVDKSGRIYTTGRRYVRYIRDSELTIRDTIDVDRKGYKRFDKGITQKEVGDSIYFRYKEYLMRTSLEEHSGNGKIDTVAILPEELMQYRTFDEELLIAAEQAPMVKDYYLMGFDKDNCFYFYLNDWKYDERDEPENLCKKYTILKYRLKEKKLIKEKEVLLELARDKEECSKRAMLHFVKQFHVTGDGTIYWLHGTVDTVKVSEIIF